jgi:hypothetical protein
MHMDCTQGRSVHFVCAQSRMSLQSLSASQMPYSVLHAAPRLHSTQRKHVTQPAQVGDMQMPTPLLELLAADELEDAALEEAPVADDDSTAEDELACVIPPAPLACDEDACELEPLPPAPLLPSEAIPPAESEHAATTPIAQETKTKATSPRCIPLLSRRSSGLSSTISRVRR